jgi:hypothetical protein
VITVSYAKLCDFAPSHIGGTHYFAIAFHFRLSVGQRIGGWLIGRFQGSLARKRFQAALGLRRVRRCCMGPSEVLRDSLLSPPSRFADSPTSLTEERGLVFLAC